MNRQRERGTQFIRQIEKQIAAQAGAEGAVLAPLYTQLAQLHLGQGQVAEAAKALGEVARLAEETGELVVAAQTTQVRGLLLAQEGMTPEARLVLLEAVALYAAVGDEGQTTAVAHQLVQKFPELREDLRPYLGDNLPAEVQLDQLWAEVREAWQAGQIELAQERLDTAVSFAYTHNLVTPAELTLLRQLLSLTNGTITAEQMADLLEQSPTQLPAGIVDDNLHYALSYLQGGALEPAIERARQVRFAARNSHDPYRVVRYQLASLVLAEAHNQRDERVQVLAAWLTCREFLAANLGSAGAEAIDQILDALRLRWGQEEMNTAVADYQAYTAMHGSFQA